MPQRVYLRTRTCPDCGDVAEIRRDSPAVLCAPCQLRRRAALGHALKVTEGHGDRECEVCGAPFTIYNSAVRNARQKRGVTRGRFCSNGCKGEWMRGKAPGERV